MRRSEWALIVFVIVTTAFGCAMGWLDTSTFERVWTVEDGPFEWMTVVALVWGAAICMFRWPSLSTKRQRLIYLCLIAAFIFGAGEEISWGQRIFDWRSPEYFKEHNAQGETNLHNMIVDGVKVNRLVFGLFLTIGAIFYTLILPILYRKIPKIKVLVDKWGVPLPRNVQILFYILTAVVINTIPSREKFELLEMQGCLLFSWMIWRPLNLQVSNEPELAQSILRADSRSLRSPQ